MFCSVYQILSIRDTTLFSDNDNIDDFKKRPIFIKPFNSIGTVSSSIIFLNRNDKIEFIERIWVLGEKQEIRNETRLSFPLIN